MGLFSSIARKGASVILIQNLRPQADEALRKIDSARLYRKAASSATVTGYLFGIMTEMTGLNKGKSQHHLQIMYDRVLSGVFGIEIAKEVFAAMDCYCGHLNGEIYGRPESSVDQNTERINAQLFYAAMEDGRFDANELFYNSKDVSGLSWRISSAAKELSTYAVGRFTVTKAP